MVLASSWRIGRHTSFTAFNKRSASTREAVTDDELAFAATC
jgi:hypothetical protein